MIERDDEGGSAKLKVMGKEQDKEEEEEKKVLKGSSSAYPGLVVAKGFSDLFILWLFVPQAGWFYSVHSTNTHTHTRTGS